MTVTRDRAIHMYITHTEILEDSVNDDEATDEEARDEEARESSSSLILVGNDPKTGRQTESLASTLELLWMCWSGC